MNLEEYLYSLRGKTVAVIGIGVSNQPLIQLLRQGVHRPVLTPLLEFSQDALRTVVQPGQGGARPDTAVLLYAEEPHEAVFRNGAEFRGGV